MFDSVPLSTLAQARAAEWRPGIAGAGPANGEIFAASNDGAGAALALSLALDQFRAKQSDQLAERVRDPAWLWVQDTRAIRSTGLPYRPGLPAGLRGGLVHVAAPTPEDALFALEEGLRCRDLAFVIGEITGNPKALDFMASRRLSLAVERHGIPLWLVRLDARCDLSSARMRWDTRSSPSPQPRWNREAPGMPTWRAELFRARNHPLGEWILRDDGTTLVADRNAAGRIDAANPSDLAAQTGDRAMAAQ